MHGPTTSLTATEGPLAERIVAHGHEHVTADHETTLEVTTDDYLTPAGDCIIGIDADRAPAAFGGDFVDACRDARATITATIAVGGQGEDTANAVTVTGRGDPELSFESDRGAVLRRSEYVDDRTVMLEADAAAADLDAALISALSEGAALEVLLQVDPPE